MNAPIFNWSYRKVGGLRFVRLGRFGFSFWLSRDCTMMVNHDR